MGIPETMRAAVLTGPNRLAMVTNNVQVHSVRGEGRANCARAISLMRQRKVDGRPLITHRFPLEAIAEGFRVFTGREGGAIKGLIRP